MLYWAITFFVVALVAAVLGFGGIAGTAASIAQFLAILFAILFVGSLIVSLFTGNRPNQPPV